MWSLAIAILGVACAALIGAQFMPGEWYAVLAKPEWTPPDWIFAPVWSALYLCIAVAGWMTWRAGRGRATTGLLLWVVQLLLNTLWSWLFFGLHRPDLAMIDIALMLGCILAFIVVMWPVRRAAALLFVPYAAWVAYASALNFYIWRFN